MGVGLLSEATANKDQLLAKVAMDHACLDKLLQLNIALLLLNIEGVHRLEVVDEPILYDEVVEDLEGVAS